MCIIDREVNAHDLEFDMKKSGIILKGHIEDQIKDADFKKQLELHLAKGFSISSNDSPVSLKLIGVDVLPTGLPVSYTHLDVYKRQLYN